MTSMLYTAAHQPDGLDKTTRYPLKEAVTFSIGEESAETLTRLGVRDPQELLQGFWKLRLLSFAEQHAEGHMVFMPITDGFAVFSTGAMPIQVAATGYLYTDRAQDHRLDFLELYHNQLRGTLLRKHKLVVVLQLKDTLMRLRLKNISVSHAVELPDWTAVSFQGVGFSYQVAAFDEPEGTDTAAAPEAAEGTRITGLPVQITDPDISIA